MQTALLVLMWVGRALAGLQLLSETGWIGDGKAREIIGKIPTLGRPIIAELEELERDVRELIERGEITADELEGLNARATAAEDRLLGALQGKVAQPA